MRRNTGLGPGADQGRGTWMSSLFGPKRQIKKELQSILDEVTVVKTVCEKSRKSLLGLIQVKKISHNFNFCFRPAAARLPLKRTQFTGSLPPN